MGRMKLWWLPVLALAGGCDPNDDVVGPFTGEVRRFVVDELRLPATGQEADAMGGDLDGDGFRENGLGSAISSLRTFDQITLHAADMIRSGVLASTVELQADDLTNDDSVGVRYLGADGFEATVVGGRFRDGAFHPNRTATTDHPGRARVRLPVFVHADPAEVPLHGLEIFLEPEAGGGYLATLHGAVTFPDALAAVQQGIVQMMAAVPGEHRTVANITDGDPRHGNDDGVISPFEIESSDLIRSLLAPDIRIRALEDSVISIGFQVHLRPCAEGRCIDAVPEEPCQDRVRDGDETDVDCGGSCAVACAGSQACLSPDDCQSGTCDAGVCAAPSCTDGRKDGFESDLDCGGNCPGCAAGKRCEFDGDCASMSCITSAICNS